MLALDLPDDTEDLIVQWTSSKVVGDLAVDQLRAMLAYSRDLDRSCLDTFRRPELYIQEIKVPTNPIRVRLTPPENGGVSGTINAGLAPRTIDYIEFFQPIEATISLNGMLALDVLYVNHDDELVEGQVLLIQENFVLTKKGSVKQWGVVAKVAGDSEDFSSDKRQYIADLIEQGYFPDEDCDFINKHSKLILDYLVFRR